VQGDQVALPQNLRDFDPFPIQVRAVRRFQILYPNLLPLEEKTAVATGDTLVVQSVVAVEMPTDDERETVDYGISSASLLTQALEMDFDHGCTASRGSSVSNAAEATCPSVPAESLWSATAVRIQSTLSRFHAKKQTLDATDCLYQGYCITAKYCPRHY